MIEPRASLRQKGDPSPVKAGTKLHARRSPRTLSREGFEVDALLDEADLVTKPLHRGARHEGRTFETVGRAVRVAEVPRERRDRGRQRRRELSSPTFARRKTPVP